MDTCVQNSEAILFFFRAGERNQSETEPTYMGFSNNIASSYCNLS